MPCCAKASRRSLEISRIWNWWQMPEMGGIDAIGAIRGEFPEARIIVLTTYTGDVEVMRALKAGAWAYLRKGLLRKELTETIRAVHAGQKRIAPEITAEIAEHAMDGALTAREIDVLRLIAEGNANKVWSAFALTSSYRDDQWLHVVLAILAAGVAGWAPGAWSVNARLFGRKRFEIDSRNRRK